MFFTLRGNFFYIFFLLIIIFLYTSSVKNFTHYCHSFFTHFWYKKNAKKCVVTPVVTLFFLWWSAVSHETEVIFKCTLKSHVHHINPSVPQYTLKSYISVSHSLANQSIYIPAFTLQPSKSNRYFCICIPLYTLIQRSQGYLCIPIYTVQPIYIYPTVELHNEVNDSEAS